MVRRPQVDGVKKNKPSSTYGVVSAFENVLYISGVIGICPCLDDVEKNKYVHKPYHVIIVCRGGIGDVLRTCVTPLALAVQRVAGSRREKDQVCHSALEKLTEAKAALEKLRFWWFTSVLLCTRLRRADLKALWGALAFSAAGRAFPRLALSLRQIMFAREFTTDAH